MIQANKQEARVALVTGGARRIGGELVKKLHEAGFRVVIHCRYSLNEATILAQSLNKQRVDSAFVVQNDLNQLGSAMDIIQKIHGWAGRLDVLVNNASLFIRSELSELDNKEWDSLFNIHVKAPYLLSLAARSLLAQHHGVIINITDIHAEKPLKHYSVYCQSKAALEMQTKSLAREFAPEIRVNAVAPGAILWPESGNTLSHEEQQRIIAKTPLKCHGRPEFIAQAALSLIENPFITGQILKVDGGRSLRE